MTAFYNEIDPFAAAWLRELIAAGHVAPGVVDERDIRDICPEELAGFDQCHFFAGIGGWSYAARLAGIPDDYPLWTGSCPCQPFSAAGGRAGFADERHLWPAFFHLIEQCEPELVAGEQVSGGNVDPWFDLVQADLEGMGYAFGLCPSPSAGIGAPHIRDRAFWLAHAESGGFAKLGDALDAGRGGHADSGLVTGGVADAERQRVRGAGCGSPASSTGGMQGANGQREWLRPHSGAGHNALVGRSTGPTNGFWRDADWLGCTDGKWRPVEPDTFPLADGVPARVGRLRGYGNAINAEQAALFLQVAIAAISETSLEIAA